ncbi:hypothetical protein [Thalassomonas actiniarum]|uniref:Uncharacterized protein n=1 Tax=Thalassomonas actiniarum TaxID=485447 RepID=A0AAE9YST3_9GAMM|nr:hypothetical protein [Thalassomonas actiniarum]WDE00187.1 hypothetical protein SG35_005915 [Thalassomonas actiniarum]
MLSPIEELKIQAKKHHKAHSGKSDATLSNGHPPRLKDSQLVIARKYGFRHWGHAREVLEGSSCRDYGTFWYKPQCSALLNLWCASYKEAALQQKAQGGFILPYKTQYLVVEHHYLELLGLDSRDANWAEINFDWCSGDIGKRRQLALQRIQHW